MNGFVIAAGSCVQPLSTHAKAAAKQIGAISVDVGDTECKIPLATAYIEKIESAGCLGPTAKDDPLLTNESFKHGPIAGKPVDSFRSFRSACIPRRLYLPLGSPLRKFAWKIRLEGSKQTELTPCPN